MGEAAWRTCVCDLRSGRDGISHGDNVSVRCGTNVSDSCGNNVFSELVDV